MFTVDWDIGWVLQYSKPQSPECIYHWNAPRNFANHRVSAHLTLAQHIQEALSTTEDQTSRNSSPKCSGCRLWRSPLPCQWPSWWCGHTGSSSFVTSCSGQSAPPSAEGRVTMGRGPLYECCGDREMSLWSPDASSMGRVQLSPVHSFSGNVDTSHVTACTAERKRPPPPHQLGSLPGPSRSVPSWTSWSHLNVELARWHFADLITSFIIIYFSINIHHSSIAYWNKHWSICQIFSQILFLHTALHIPHARSIC